MDFERLRYYKDLFIDNYDYSQQSENMIWFHDVQLKDVPKEVNFHFADSVVFEYDDKTLNISFYQERLSEPIELKNLI